MAIIRFIKHLVSFGKSILPSHFWNKHGYFRYTRFNNLKKNNADFKTILSVGGWNFGTAKMTAMLATEANRAEFCSSSIEFLRERNFDGLDLHFQYPGSRGSPPQDKDRFAMLVKVGLILMFCDVRWTPYIPRMSFMCCTSISNRCMTLEGHISIVVLLDKGQIGYKKF